jgi:ABC-type multidrug transport system ATPase subunit
MSDKILKALMELFALIVKQDGGVIEEERTYVLNFLEKQLTTNVLIRYLLLFEELADSPDEIYNFPEDGSPSIKRNMKILNICEQINRTLNKEQKVVVLIRLYELINVSKRFTPSRLNIISIVVQVFRILPEEVEVIEQYVKYNESDRLQNPAILYLRPGEDECDICHREPEIYSGTTIIILRISSVDLYFIKYLSNRQFYLNGIPIVQEYIYTFPKGSAFRTQYGHTFYYSDITSKFLSSDHNSKLTFLVRNVTYRLPSKQKILANINFAAVQGNLVGVIGGSGSGKTTLLNLMSGMLQPASGTISLNGFDPFRDKKQLEGVIGYIPQDDLLIEDLTVFENLYFAASQCFGHKSRKQVLRLVEQMLTSLGLIEKKDLKVGSIFNKTISGGQRKRLNIALELIREPSVLFIDEPTTGLSSKDAENIMDLLRELTLKGKLVFTVIHQPSSAIYKMFDTVLILDQGGYMVYYGNPVDSVIFFKTLDSQINASLGECPSCGSVNPEIIFKIIEAQVVDEFGRYTEKRKVKPKEWSEKFRSQQPDIALPHVIDPPQKNLDRPGSIRQFVLYLSRDLKSKISDLQYVILTLLEAPVLAFILSSIIRYIPDPNSRVYHFSENENIPVYIFMSIIVAAFMGLTQSAEEIFRDRKILKREQFLNLSRHSYLVSKVFTAFTISGIQVLLFVAVGNSILEIKGMYFNYWLALLATAFCSNMLGLIISGTFSSVISIYIVIPLLLIPMMILSGAMFPFDKLNRNVTRIDKVPLIAEVMPTRWSYEALMVSQFRDNRYNSLRYTDNGETHYTLGKKISIADFNNVYRIPELTKVLRQTREMLQNRENNTKQISHNLKLLQNELVRISKISMIPLKGISNSLNIASVNTQTLDSLGSFLKDISAYFSQQSNSATLIRDQFYHLNEQRIRNLEKEYYNYKLEEIVTKYYETDKLLRYKDTFIQNTDPVYLDPEPKGSLNFRSHFFAPTKSVLGIRFNTFSFNTGLLFLAALLLYVILYYDLIKRLISITWKFNIRE